jgi:alpha-D-ribose 1-methylphosphonate 5-triphosphate synthase subunit PhnI
MDEDRTLVTNNFGDFRRLCEAHSIHPGLIVLPTPSREIQQQLLDAALAHIERQTELTGAADPGEFMISRVVEVSEAGVCADFRLPEPK